MDFFSSKAIWNIQIWILWIGGGWINKTAIHCAFAWTSWFVWALVGPDEKLVNVRESRPFDAVQIAVIASFVACAQIWQKYDTCFPSWKQILVSHVLDRHKQAKCQELSWKQSDKLRLSIDGAPPVPFWVCFNNQKNSKTSQTAQRVSMFWHVVTQVASTIAFFGRTKAEPEETSGPLYTRWVDFEASQTKCNLWRRQDQMVRIRMWTFFSTNAQTHTHN